MLIFLNLIIGCVEKPDSEVYCNDDETANLVSDDGDCDGALKSEDCDDADPNSTIRWDDIDCDGVLTADDCNDSDADSTVVAEDGDCDGILTDDDCDDDDDDSNAIANDDDCDGTITEEDCDDADPDSLTRLEDGDCDGVLTDDDCDDADPELHAIVNDADCDGLVSEEDCNDNNPDSTSREEDSNCNGSIDESGYVTDRTSGSGVVGVNSYVGTQTRMVSQNDVSGAGGEDVVVWNVTGTAIPTPSECINCQFAFELEFVQDYSQSTVDYDVFEAIYGTSSPNWAYAYGESEYGNTLFLRDLGGWYPAMADGFEMIDDLGGTHQMSVSFDGSNFSYDNNRVDYYYSYIPGT